MSARDPQEKPKVIATPLASIAPQIARPTARPEAETPPPEAVRVETLPLVPLSDTDVEPEPEPSEAERDATMAEAVAAAAAGDAARTEARRQAAMPYDAAADAAARAAKERGGKRRAPRRDRAAATPTTRTAAPVVVPRTIAEMQRQAAGELPMSAADAASLDAEADGATDGEPEAVLLVPFRAAATLAAIMWLLGSLLPQLALVVAQGVANDTTASLTASYVTFALGGGAALLLLVRNWRRVFDTGPDELKFASVLDLWQRRYSHSRYPNGLPRRDGWVTTAAAVIFGLVFITVVITASVVSSWPASLASIPVLLFMYLLRVLMGAVFFGWLHRAVRAAFPPTRASLVAGVAFGLSIAVVNIIPYLAAFAPWSSTALPPEQASIAVTLVTVVATADLLLGIALVYFRERTRSVWAAIALQITLHLLFLGAGVPV